MIKWGSRSAVQLRLAIEFLLILFVAALYVGHYLDRLFALLGVAFFFVLMTVEVCRTCGLPWVFQKPKALWREGACARCQAEIR